MAQSNRVLLQGGIILQHDEHDAVHVLWDTDLLIEGDLIAKIRKNIPKQPNDRVIDCRDKIISPGFIDTHHHVWQMQLKGRHSDDTLLDYHPKGNLQFFNYKPDDIFWGELGGLMESIDGGTTCVVDHAHMAYSPDYVFAGVSATLVSGIRSVFCYSHVPQIKVWHHQYELESQQIPSWFLKTLEQVDQKLKASDGKVTLGLGFDGYHLPKEDVIRVFEAARKVGVRRITSHWRRNSVAGSFSVPQILKDLDLLGPDILLSHATGSTDGEIKMLTDAGAYISATPATESQMAHGDVIGFRPDVLGSLGADCESNNPSSILHAMQIGLAVTRSHRNSSILAQDRFPKHVEPTTLHAFNLATIHGARAIGESDRLGSLKEGKQADVIIFDATSPVMTCAADHDPLVAVVRHASPHEVESVIIGGVVKKEGGKLVDVTCDADNVSGWEGCEKVTAVVKTGKLSWSEIALQLRRSRRDVQGRIDKCDVQAAREKVLAMWGMTDGEKVFM